MPDVCERSSPRIRFGAIAVLALIGLVPVAACGAHRDPARADLLDEVPRADIKPVDHPPDIVAVRDAAVGGDVRRGLFMRVPSRVTVHIHVPPRAALTSALGIVDAGGAPADAGVLFQAGISDGRVYEPLFERSLLVRDARTWQPLVIDLRRYGGWQWSVFYRPSAITWALTFNVYAAGAAANLTGVWATPVIERTP
jgi:hypothetical protein